MKWLSISGIDNGDDQDEVLGTKETNLVGLGHDVGEVKAKRWCWQGKNKEMILVVAIRAILWNMVMLIGGAKTKR